MNEQQNRIEKLIKASLIGLVSVLVGSFAFAIGFQSEKRDNK
jgi:hypothetical protein